MKRAGEKAAQLKANASPTGPSSSTISAADAQRAADALTKAGINVNDPALATKISTMISNSNAVDKEGINPGDLHDVKVKAEAFDTIIKDALVLQGLTLPQQIALDTAAHAYAVSQGKMTTDKFHEINDYYNDFVAQSNGFDPATGHAKPSDHVVTLNTATGPESFTHDLLINAINDLGGWQKIVV